MAEEIYRKLEGISSEGTSLGTMGLADLSMYAGRYDEATSIVMRGIAADEKEHRSGEIAHKLIALAEAYNALGRKNDARSSALRAVRENALDDGIHFLAAQALIDAGDDVAAQQLATDLERKLQRQTKSFALVIKGSIAANQRRLSDAVDAYREAQKYQDAWFSHLLLGRAYIEAGHYVEALAELETCATRASEVTDLFDANTTTLRYLPPLYYWLGRAQEIGRAHV